MNAHAHTNFGLTELAEACHVSPRALQYAFAHQDLLESDPGTGLTVTAIAARWGFANHSRFAADYHAVCGTSPSHTLRTPAP